MIIIMADTRSWAPFPDQRHHRHQHRRRHHRRRPPIASNLGTIEVQQPVAQINA